MYQLVKRGSMGTPTAVLGEFWTELREKSRVRIDHPEPARRSRCGRRRTGRDPLDARDRVGRNGARCSARRGRGAAGRIAAASDRRPRRTGSHRDCTRTAHRSATGRAGRGPGTGQGAGRRSCAAPGARGRTGAHQRGAGCARLRAPGGEGRVFARSGKASRSR
ncbi:hypothetical protein [Paraburkholderia aromaticivorans]|uniref:hypothetical protein n=1 Tax=Paraburkholderia aromaticivorans TaxID=2026199 RepID=UPI003D67E5A1